MRSPPGPQYQVVQADFMALGLKLIFISRAFVSFWGQWVFFVSISLSRNCCPVVMECHADSDCVVTNCHALSPNLIP